MIVFSRFRPIPALPSLLLLVSPGFAVAASPFPAVSSPLTELRKAPVFHSETLALAKTWGVSIPAGTSFQVEKVYGRWVFGHPSPLANMRTADQAPLGWVFSRQLLLPGDTDTLSQPQRLAFRDVIYHARAASKNLPKSQVEFLENLTLSEKTLAAFSLPENGKSANSSLPSADSLSIFPLAFADDKEPAPMGLTGTDLSFLDQEIHVIQEKRKAEARLRESRKLKTPPPPPLNNTVRAGVLGRFLLERYLELPPLSLEEVDGYIYMRATAMRALRGCPKSVQAYWKNRRWAHFRAFRLKSRPEIRHPWLELALPGGTFAVSARAIEQASNEAELAFLLVRQLARELRLKRKAPSFDVKGWPQSLPATAEQVWDDVLKAQSTKDAEGIDVSDEIAVDMLAAECIARAGYRPMAAHAYLKKMLLAKEEPWAEWFSKNSIGISYRIERLATLIQEAVAQGKFPDGNDSQAKRFASAARQWNLLP